MEVGLALPQYDYSVAGEQPLRWPTVVEWAKRAEKLGFSSLWLSDHLFLSIERYGAHAGDYEAIEPIAGLAALSQETTTARLGTLVLCAQLRPPLVLAKALATLDRLSGGRLVAGIGAGWFQPEFDAAGIAFETPGRRVAQLAEALGALRAALGDGAGGFRPRPVQEPRPPLWVGGRGTRLLGVVARLADGWNAAGWVGTLEAYRERREALHRQCRRVGRDPATVTLSVNRYALVGEDEADVARRWERLRSLTPPGVLDALTLDQYRRGRLVGTVAEVRAQLSEWSSEGVSTLVVNLGALPFSVTTPDDLDLLASAIT